MYQKKKYLVGPDKAVGCLIQKNSCKIILAKGICFKTKYFVDFYDAIKHIFDILIFFK